MSALSLTKNDGSTTVRDTRRPKALPGMTVQITTGCGKMYVIMNAINGELIEVLVKHGKAGGCVSAQCDLVGRLLTASAKYKIPLTETIRNLSGIGCHIPAFSHGVQIKSCADGVAHALNEFVEEHAKSLEDETEIYAEFKLVA